MMSEKAEEKKTIIDLIHISKRIYDVPKFKFYAIADGIFTVFARCKQGIAELLQKKQKNSQISLFVDVGFGWGWKNGEIQKNIVIDNNK